MSDILKEFKNTCTDLRPLYEMLLERGIDCKIREHPLVSLEPGAFDILGYHPVGTEQILIKKGTSTYSVIRGVVSFGAYEIMNMGGGEKFKDPERFGTPEELINEL